MKKIILIIVISVILIIVGISIFVENNREKPCSSCMKSKADVPLPTEEDIIRNFFSLIDEDRPIEAVMMMDGSSAGDDSQKQDWAVQFNAIETIEVVKIEPSMTEGWNELSHIYELTLDVKMKPESENAAIPYFNWSDGENKRWVTIVLENDTWKISGIGTGP